MEPKKGIVTALSKIKSLVWNMSQERRISSDELEDFNTAMKNVWAYLDEYSYMTEAARHSNAQLTESLDKSAGREKKLHILLQVLGMHQRGIEIWLEYPIRFVTIINARLRKANQPIYSEEYFYAIDRKWRELNERIDTDMRRVESATKMRYVYHNAPSERTRRQALDIMQGLAEDIPYIQQDIKKGKTANELRTKIINYWYDQLSAYHPSAETN